MCGKIGSIKTAVATNDEDELWDNMTELIKQQVRTKQGHVQFLIFNVCNFQKNLLESRFQHKKLPNHLIRHDLSLAATPRFGFSGVSQNSEFLFDFAPVAFFFFRIPFIVLHKGHYCLCTQSHW